MDTTTIPDTTPYMVKDIKTGCIVKSYVYGKRAFARRYAEKRNQEYGAVRFVCVF